MLSLPSSLLTDEWLCQASCVLRELAMDGETLPCINIPLHRPPGDNTVSCVDTVVDALRLAVTDAQQAIQPSWFTHEWLGCVSFLGLTDVERRVVQFLRMEGTDSQWALAHLYNLVPPSLFQAFQEGEVSTHAQELHDSAAWPPYMSILPPFEKSVFLRLLYGPRRQLYQHGLWCPFQAGLRATTEDLCGFLLFGHTDVLPAVRAHFPWVLQEMHWLRFVNVQPPDEGTASFTVIKAALLGGVPPDHITSWWGDWAMTIDYLALAALDTAGFEACMRRVSTSPDGWLIAAAEDTHLVPWVLTHGCDAAKREFFTCMCDSSPMDWWYGHFSSPAGLHWFLQALRQSNLLHRVHGPFDDWFDLALTGDTSEQDVPALLQCSRWRRGSDEARSCLLRASVWGRAEAAQCVRSFLPDPRVAEVSRLILDFATGNPRRFRYRDLPPWLSVRELGRVLWQAATVNNQVSTMEWLRAHGVFAPPCLLLLAVHPTVRPDAFDTLLHIIVLQEAQQDSDTEQASTASAESGVALHQVEEDARFLLTADFELWDSSEDEGFGDDDDEEGESDTTGFHTSGASVLPRDYSERVWRAARWSSELECMFVKQCIVHRNLRALKRALRALPAPSAASPPTLNCSQCVITEDIDCIDALLELHRVSLSTLLINADLRKVTLPFFQALVERVREEDDVVRYLQHLAHGRYLPIVASRFPRAVRDNSDTCLLRLASSNDYEALAWFIQQFEIDLACDTPRLQSLLLQATKGDCGLTLRYLLSQCPGILADEAFYDELLHTAMYFQSVSVVRALTAGERCLTVQRE